MNSFSKSHPRIELRGKLDSLNANIILLQSYSEHKAFIDDLEEFRCVIRQLQSCEAGDRIFDNELILWGMTEDEIHTRSHNPSKFYGLGHILPHYDMKFEAAEINMLRTLTREAELCAVNAFGDDDQLRIIHVLNRLSSALYILTYKYLPENYNRVIKFGSSE